MTDPKKSFVRTGLISASLLALTLSSTTHADDFEKWIPKDLVNKAELKKLQRDLQKVTELPQYQPAPKFEVVFNPDRPPPPNIDPLGFPADATFDLARQPRQTFLHFMQRTVKPKLDSFATQGFQLRDGNSMINALNEVDTKVRQSAIGAVGNNPRDLGIIANSLRAAPVKFSDLDDQIRAARPGMSFRDAGTLSTYFALASGGGVALRLDAQNMTYNVNYGTGVNKDTKQEFKRPDGSIINVTKPGDVVTGRSFGAGPGRNANDVSDAAYLRELEEFLKSADAQKTGQFYRTIMQILTNLDSSGLHAPAPFNLSPQAQTVITDFVAVFTAEEDRHLMEDLQKFEFDVALAEVTWVSVFSAGGARGQVHIPFNGQLLENIPDVDRDTKVILNTTHRASLQDWTRFSRIPCHQVGEPKTNPQRPGCNRSGPNVSKADRRFLQASISRVARADRTLAPLLRNLEIAMQQMNYTGRTGKQLGQDDIFQELTNFLIPARAAATPANPNAPEAFSPLPLANQLSEAFAAFMVELKNQADTIADRIEQSQPKVGTQQAQQLRGFMLTQDAAVQLPVESPKSEAAAAVQTDDIKRPN